jgi:hypothetical protein
MILPLLEVRERNVELLIAGNSVEESKSDDPISNTDYSVKEQKILRKIDQINEISSSKESSNNLMSN